MDVPQLRSQQPRRERALLRLRHLAALTRGPATGAVALALAVLLPLPAVAEEPTTPPATAAPPITCAERFPAEGPAGVDLRLGCIVGELVGLYTASSGQPPAPASTYGLALAGTIAGGLLVAWLVVRFGARRAGRRLAPVLPATWWVCDRCHSVNAAETTRCYACGAPPGTGPALPTSDRPETPQSFGGGGKR